jgi:hypothetical protein
MNSAYFIEQLRTQVAPRLDNNSVIHMWQRQKSSHSPFLGELNCQPQAVHPFNCSSASGKLLKPFFGDWSEKAAPVSIIWELPRNQTIQVPSHCQSIVQSKKGFEQRINLVVKHHLSSLLRDLEIQSHRQVKVHQIL